MSSVCYAVPSRLDLCWLGAISNSLKPGSTLFGIIVVLEIIFNISQVCLLSLFFPYVL